MKQIRSAVCKRANELIKAGKGRSESFKQAWAEVKNAPRKIKTSELKSGDVIRIEYGVVGNFVVCTVRELSAKLMYGKYHIVKAVRGDGRVVEFTSKPEEMIDIAA